MHPALRGTNFTPPKNCETRASNSMVIVIAYKLPTRVPATHNVHPDHQIICYGINSRHIDRNHGILGHDAVNRG